MALLSQSKESIQMLIELEMSDKSDILLFRPTANCELRELASEKQILANTKPLYFHKKINLIKSSAMNSKFLVSSLMGRIVDELLSSSMPIIKRCRLYRFLCVIFIFLDHEHMNY